MEKFEVGRPQNYSMLRESIVVSHMIVLLGIGLLRCW